MNHIDYYYNSKDKYYEIYFIKIDIIGKYQMIGTGGNLKLFLKIKDFKLKQYSFFCCQVLYSLTFLVALYYSQYLKNLYAK